MIRKVSISEIGVMVEAAQMFFDEGNIPGGFKPEVFHRTIEGMMTSGNGVVFGLFGPDGGFQGALAAVKYSDMFNGDRLAVEIAWYVMPQFRGRGIALLTAFEDWARAEKCARMQMIHLQALQPEKLKAFYEHVGYRHFESGYLKIL